MAQRSSRQRAVRCQRYLDAESVQDSRQGWSEASRLQNVPDEEQDHSDDDRDRDSEGAKPKARAASVRGRRALELIPRMLRSNCVAVWRPIPSHALTPRRVPAGSLRLCAHRVILRAGRWATHGHRWPALAAATPSPSLPSSLCSETATAMSALVHRPPHSRGCRSSILMGGGVGGCFAGMGEPRTDDRPPVDQGRGCCVRRGMRGRRDDYQDSHRPTKDSVSPRRRSLRV